MFSFSHWLLPANKKPDDRLLSFDESIIIFPRPAFSKTAKLDTVETTASASPKASNVWASEIEFNWLILLISTLFFFVTSKKYFYDIVPNATTTFLPSRSEILFIPLHFLAKRPKFNCDVDSAKPFKSTPLLTAVISGNSAYTATSISFAAKASFTAGSAWAKPLSSTVYPSFLSPSCR